MDRAIRTAAKARTPLEEHQEHVQRANIRTVCATAFAVTWTGHAMRMDVTESTADAPRATTKDALAEQLVAH